MEKRENRLFAYTAAAGLGAFCLASVAQAAPVLPDASIYTDIDDVQLLEGANGTGNHCILDLNDDGIDDVDIYMLGQEQSWFMRFRAVVLNGAVPYIDMSLGLSANYIRPFSDGGIIGPSNPLCQVGALVAPVLDSNAARFGNLTADKYMAIKLGTGEWGWIRARYVRDGISSGVGYGMVYDYAVTPEPGSLALLAAGAGALAFRRR